MLHDEGIKGLRLGTGKDRGKRSWITVCSCGSEAAREEDGGMGARQQNGMVGVSHVRYGYVRLEGKHRRRVLPAGAGLAKVASAGVLVPSSRSK
jgi:hypothetical protein